MAIRPILCLPDPQLRAVSEKVGVVDDSVRALMDDMLQTMYDAPGIGLAAIQIGVAKRVIVMDLSKKGEPPAPRFFVDPEILETSEEESVYEEGCLSIPEYYEDVSRSARIRVRYLDRENIMREIDADGLLATCLQHEIDHLEGRLFIDHLSRLKRERAIKKFTKAARSEPGAKKFERAPEIREKRG
ncbi:peptide deformylase [uncultured Rhodoblastus sp.]|uniref:peptide deformylase n=1 Tax=uncultured Rhodoblastus sp. TaxID=543037 RepID=UPI0025D9039C|nr:peptide deformylase [uncultured Rhodoblastus sp.]